VSNQVEQAKQATVRVGDVDVAACIFLTPICRMAAVWSDQPDVMVCAPSEAEALDKFRRHAAVWTGIAAMKAFRGPAGDYMRVNPTHFICGPDLESTALGLFVNQNDASGASNSLFGRFKRENIIIDPEVPTGYWAMLDCSKPVKPCAFIKEQWPAEFTSLTQIDDEHVFKADEFLYGTRFLVEVCALCWWLCYGSNGTES